MKKRFIVLLAVWLTACSSSDSTKYYQLTTPPVAASVGASTSSSLGQAPKRLWIQSINLPDALASTSIAFQTSEVEYRLAEQNVWASPLDQQLQQTLVTNLSNLLPNWLITTTSSDEDQASLEVTVTAFQGRWDGHAIAKGYWLYHNQNQTIRQPFEILVPLKDDGYQALVQALSQGWYQEAQQIASQITP